MLWVQPFTVWGNKSHPWPRLLIAFSFQSLLSAAGGSEEEDRWPQSVDADLQWTDNYFQQSQKRIHLNFSGQNQWRDIRKSYAFDWCPFLVPKKKKKEMVKATSHVCQPRAVKTIKTICFFLVEISFKVKRNSKWEKKQTAVNNYVVNLLKANRNRSRSCELSQENWLHPIYCN